MLALLFLTFFSRVTVNYFSLSPYLFSLNSFPHSAFTKPRCTQLFKRPKSNRSENENYLQTYVVERNGFYLLIIFTILLFVILRPSPFLDSLISFPLAVGIKKELAVALLSASKISKF